MLPIRMSRNSLIDASKGAGAQQLLEVDDASAPHSNLTSIIVYRYRRHKNHDPRALGVSLHLCIKDEIPGEAIESPLEFRAMQLAHCLASGRVDTHKDDYEENRNAFIGMFYILLGFICITCNLIMLSAITRHPLINHACFKLLTILCVFDLLNLFFALPVSGVLSLLRLNHCNSGRWINTLGYVIMICWTAYCASAQVLALNRLLEFWNKPLCNTLFRRNRAWVWIAVPTVYCVLLNGLGQAPFYFYDPYGGGWVFNTGRWINTLGYVIMICWTAYCASAQVLALNRLLEFWNKPLCNTLFRRNRAWVWIAVPTVYCVLLNGLGQAPFYFYDPYGGGWVFNTYDRGAPNYVMLINNYFKFTYLLIVYTAMLFFLYQKIAKGTDRVSTLQKSVSLS
uniref:G_PROTEIN_RECEP_F1_2 domain-containing protein n=2 Tax=Steinernema glaseri TaxID=37863 RepID=A0A1I7ZD23_9BILA